MAENVVVAVGDFIVCDREWAVDVGYVSKVTEKMVMYDSYPGGRVARNKIMFAGPEKIAKHLAEQIRSSNAQESGDRAAARLRKEKRNAEFIASAIAKTKAPTFADRRE